MALNSTYQLLKQIHLGNAGSGAAYLRIYARVSSNGYDIANNRTKIYVKSALYYENSSYFYTGATTTKALSCTGLAYQSGDAAGNYYQGETTLCETSGYVTHNNDGTKSIDISANFTSTPWGWNGTAYASATLPTIPRHASITAAPNFNDEENPTINYSNPAGNAITSIQACIADASGEIIVPYRDIPKNGSSYTFELTDEEREKLRWATINSNTLAVQFYVTSVIGGTTKWSSSNKILTIVNAMPEIVVSAKDTGGYSVPLTGNENKIIKGFNYVNVSMTSTSKKGSTIKSQTITNGSQKINGSSGGFTNTEDNIFVFSATDSRGNTVTKNITLDMVDYIKLTCNLKTKNPTADGNMAFKISGNYFNGNFGAVGNNLEVAFRYKENDGEYSEWLAAEPIPTISGNTYETTINLTGLNYRSTYTLQARAIDKTITLETKEKKVRTIPVYDWGENDFQFNVDIYDKFNQLINNGLAEYDGGNIDVNETLSSLCLAQYNTPNNSLYYVMTFFYGTKSLTSNRTQIAIPYIYDISQKKFNIFVRQYVNGEWNEWTTQNYYSTSEQIIGNWVDGRPIYRRVFKGKTNDYGPSKVTSDISTNNIELINYSGYMTQKNGPNYKMGIGGYINENWYSAIYLESNGIYLYHPANLGSAEYMLWVEYIKTTD